MENSLQNPNVRRAVLTFQRRKSDVSLFHLPNFYRSWFRTQKMPERRKWRFCTTRVNIQHARSRSSPPSRWGSSKVWSAEASSSSHMYIVLESARVKLACGSAVYLPKRAIQLLPWRWAPRDGFRSVRTVTMNENWNWPPYPTPFKVHANCCLSGFTEIFTWSRPKTCVPDKPKGNSVHQLDFQS